MKTLLRKSTLVLCLIGFVAGLAMPVEAARTGKNPPPPVVFIPKPVTSYP